MSLLHVAAYGLARAGARDVLGLLLGITAAALAARVLRQATRRSGLLLAVVAVAQAALFMQGLLAASPPFPQRALLVAALAVYLGAVVLTAGLPARRLEAGAIIALAVSIAAGVLVLEAAASRILARRDVVIARAVAPANAKRYEGQLDRHPELGPIPFPNSVTEEIYPDNPRRYFRTRDRTWRLNLQPTSAAALTPAAEGFSLAIERADDSLAWHIQAERRGYALQKGTTYEVGVRVRASGPRKIMSYAGLARDPWTGLGLFERADVGPEWEDFRWEFTATATEPNARLVFDLGGDTADVEVADVVLRRSADGEPVVNPPRLEYYVTSEWNSRGCRALEYSTPADPGTFRILVLGDSYAAGVGVHLEDMFTSVMERRLQERAAAGGDSTRFEVVGCGVSGFSTREERLYYELRARAYEPDVVLVVMVWNDDRSFQDDVDMGWVHQPSKWEYLFQTAYLVQSIRHSRPDPDFSASMAELGVLQALVNEDGARLGVVVFTDNGADEWVPLAAAADSATQRLGVPLIDLRDAFLGGDHPEGWFRVHPLDGHPNELAHALAAERIQDWMERVGLVRPGG